LLPIACPAVIKPLRNWSLLIVKRISDNFLSLIRFNTNNN
jgi:hypothetical protein